MNTAASDTLPVECDVAVIGGGPAGSTIAALLAERNWRVALFEKERHPRFHIGESLLPMNMPLFERLGVREQVEALGIIKYGAHFVSDRHPMRERTAYFDRALEPSQPYALEVRRSEFDHLLLKNSAAKGAQVYEGIRVTGVDFCNNGDGVRVRCVDEHGDARQWRARQLVDASGRDTFLANRFGIKKKNPRHASAAIFGHFNGVVRLTGRDEGNISILWFEHGWFWIIPLPDGVTSVGAVCSPDYLKTRGSMEPGIFLWRTIEQCPGAWTRMREAELIGAARATGNYSYTCKRTHGDDWLLVGDAFGFVDPVFSSGVYLAMHSAVLGAETVDARLRKSMEAPRLARRFDRRVRRGLRVFSWFIYRFTSPPLHRLFMAPSNTFRIQQAVVSVLAGDVFGNRGIVAPLLLFKAVYYWESAANWLASWRNYRQRRSRSRAVFTGGTTPHDRGD